MKDFLTERSYISGMTYRMMLLLPRNLLSNEVVLLPMIALKPLTHASSKTVDALQKQGRPSISINVLGL